MQVSKRASSTGTRVSARFLVHAAVAAALAGGSGATAFAADEPAAASELQEITVTGSRITRRDTETTSPLVTVEKEVLEKSSYISIEQALNELPEFMAGGALFGAGAVTNLTAAGDVSGGQGTGNMFDTARGVDNARAGTFTPGAATVNLRGLGVNRNIVLIDGKRGVPNDAGGAIDLNTIPQIAIGNIEVITGGASSVYGADALAGVTNIKLRSNFEGAEVRARGGINEYGGDGKEWQFSTILGSNFADGKGHAMVAMDYSKREISLWKNRSYFREVMESPLSNSGDYLFGWYPAYAAGSLPTGQSATAYPVNCNGGTCTTTSLAITAGGGTNNVFNRQAGLVAWAGNAPSQAAVNAVFADRTCGAAINCVIPNNTFYFNPDVSSTLFTTGGTASGSTTAYGPQSFTGTLGGTEANPDEVVCGYSTTFTNMVPGFQTRCNPTLSRVDYGRRLTSPREGYTLLGNAEFEVNDHVTAYSTISFAHSQTETRREPSPASGNWGVAIPYHSNPNEIYLPSVVQNTSGGYPVGSTLPEYRVGGSRGTNCAPTGGCTMAQAFPVSAELRTLLNSRPDVILNNASSPFNGMSVCELREVDSNAGQPGHVVQRTTAGGTPYTVQMDPNTGETFKICGPNSPWRLATQMGFLPPRGTFNTVTNYQLFGGLRGDLFVGDWTWDAYISEGESRTLTEYVGYVSAANYYAIMTAPNYGQGFTASSNVSNKVFTCTSGLNPFNSVGGQPQNVSQDCIDALTSNQADKQAMQQYESQLNLQGGLFDMPAGQVRAALGLSWRKNNYYFRPDSLRETGAVFDGPMGQFGVANIDGQVSSKEVYGEMLVPLLKDLPAVKNLELELGFRHSHYSTGQNVPTYKVQLSWTPIEYVRIRGGYNRAERTPNIAELYTLPTTSSQLSTGLDPCSSLNGATLPNSNVAANPRRAQIQALCSAQINKFGGNNSSAYHLSPGTANLVPAVVTFQGDPSLKSEKGDTYTAGVVLSSPFEHVLLSRITATIDWYSIKIKDAIAVQSSQQIMNACFNQDGTAAAGYADGSNPTYSLTSPWCDLIERDPVSGAISFTRTSYANNGENSVKGIDVSLRWSAALADMGLASLPGTLSLNIGTNFLMEQNQPVTVGGALQNYAGYVGASKIRANTVLGYNWSDNRVQLTWLYRLGTKGLGGDNRPTTLFAGYPTGNLFNLSAGTKIGEHVDASVNVSNLLNTKPGRAGWAYADATEGFGTFDPYGDLVGRRYSVNFTLSF